MNRWPSQREEAGWAARRFNVGFYGPETSASIELSLRRTLVRSYRCAANNQNHRKGDTAIRKGDMAGVENQAVIFWPSGGGSYFYCYMQAT